MNYKILPPQLSTIIENIRHQKDVCLWDDYDKLEMLVDYIKELEKGNKKLYNQNLDYSNEIEEYKEELGYNLTFGEYEKLNKTYEK